MDKYSHRRVLPKHARCDREVSSSREGATVVGESRQLSRGAGPNQKFWSLELAPQHQGSTKCSV